jgi:hypothetical protein
VTITNTVYYLFSQTVVVVPAQHYTLFPLALGQILREHAIPEFHLTINSGKWDYDRWGHPGEPGVGSGAELWAWMGDGAGGQTTRWAVISPLLSSDSTTASTPAGRRYKTRSRVYSAPRSAAWTHYTRPRPRAPSNPQATSPRWRQRIPCATRRSPRNACAPRTSRRSLSSCPVHRVRESQRCLDHIGSSMPIGMALVFMCAGALVLVSNLR